jgi:hypothetical protein
VQRFTDSPHYYNTTQALNNIIKGTLPCSVAAKETSPRCCGEAGDDAVGEYVLGPSW